MIDDIYLMWLGNIDGLSLKRQYILLDYFGSAHDIWFAPDKLLSSIKGIPEEVIENIINARRDVNKLKAYEYKVFSKGISFVSRFSPDYPELLIDIPNSPLGLYILGEYPKSTKLSVIGSRRCSEYGISATKQLSSDLAKHDVVIVSGMARGIDSAAHNSAIDVNGKTIAILGCGIDICYPPENAKLRRSIIEHGCIISEFPLGTKPFYANFPIRNRLISGISKGLLVTEASDKSGTMITVAHALEQGREVMSIPGNINSQLSRGTNYLIKQGATLVSDYSDVMYALGLFFNKTEQPKKNDNLKLEHNEELIYNIIGMESISYDKIAADIDLPIKDISTTLIMLEMKGLIKKQPGQKYIRGG